MIGMRNSVDISMEGGQWLSPETETFHGLHDISPDC